MSDHLVPLYQGFDARLQADPEMSIDAMRDLFEGWHQGAAEPQGVMYSEAVGAPVPATWCMPVDVDARRAAVYTHGGGYVVGSRQSHRKLAGHLAASSGVPVLVIDYRRAPEHPFPAQIDDTTAVVDWLLGQGRHSSQIVLAGDSAGGSIAIQTALRLARRGTPPGGVVGLSPWLDLELTGKSLDDNAATDAMVQRPILEIMTGLYLAGGSPADPEANAMRAELSQMPPLLLVTSEHETLRDDAVRFADLVRQAGGGPVELDVEPHQQHVFQMGAGRSSVADESLRRIGAWLGTTLDQAAGASTAQAPVG